MTTAFSKSMKNENFPVAALAGKKLRPIVEAYYKAARAADDVADASQLTEQKKLARLMLFERSFSVGINGGALENGDEDAFRLGQIFAAEKLDASLYTDLLKAFEKDARNEPIAVWEQLIGYCRLSAAPVGRFILALHDESPSAYLPAETLCAVLQISNHLQDMRKDAEQLGRCYLPQDMMAAHDVRASDMFLDKSSPALRALTAEITDKLRRMLKDASVLPALLRSRRLKMQIGIILSLTNSMIKKLEKNDALTSRIRLNLGDWIKAFCIGAPRGMLCRTEKTGSVL